MKCTNQIQHYSRGGSKPGTESLVGLYVFVDDAGQEFVNWEGDWVHVNEHPLPKKHRVEAGQRGPFVKTVPVHHPPSPTGPAFEGTSPQQRQPATQVLDKIPGTDKENPFKQGL